MKLIPYLTIVFILSCSQKQQPPKPISIEKFRDGIHHWKLFHPVNYDRYDEDNVIAIANNLVAYQNEDGGWPKNIDILAKLDLDSVVAAQKTKDQRSTLDNRNTFPQIEYVAKAYSQLGVEKYKNASLKGINYILDRQYPNGGWRGWDVDAITYNDEVMTGAMDLLLDIVQRKPWYDWLDKSKKQQIDSAFEKGLDLTLKCQVIQNGKKTAWAQQHDHKTYEPVIGRSYELPAITAFESTPIIRMLIRIRNPDSTVIHAVHSAVTWLERSRLEHVRIDSVAVDPDTIPGYSKSYQILTRKDPSASPRWARYYDVDTNEPIFCRRDGTKVDTFNEIDIERRWGYEWYGTWPKNVLQRAYPEWKERINQGS